MGTNKRPPNQRMGLFKAAGTGRGGGYQLLATWGIFWAMLIRHLLANRVVVSEDHNVRKESRALLQRAFLLCYAARQG
jgi:hypothetical protein